MVDKFISYTIVDGDNRLNITLIRNIEKLRLSIIRPSFYMINMANQSQNISFEKINSYRVMTGGEEYFFTFHIIHMHPRKIFYSLFLIRSWLKATNVKIN